MEKNFINAQIKTLRKALKLNQADFGERIGLKNGAISKMEQEGSTVTDQNIKLICEKFNVRREWLTEGTG
ncbi:MAG: helix-turn-helix transcriptional regulator, partial [Anaerovibrio sp.]|nr:helix-turn-helix transcriptional regulator [Anaerovibrio sp.]